MVVQSYFLLIFSLNPFIKFYLSWPENGSATLSFTVLYCLATSRPYRAPEVLRPGQRNVYRSAKSRRKRWSQPEQRNRGVLSE